MQFAPKHVVTMVACVSAAVVLAPVGVMAATGITITDPFNSSRAARVTDRGTLWVESRAGVASDSFNVHFEDVTDVQGRTVLDVANPNRIAVTSLVVTVRGDNAASVNHVRLYAQVRTSGTSACGSLSGWSSPKVLAAMAVHAGDTEQLLWSGPALVLPTPAAGQRVCLRAQQTQFTGSTSTAIQVTGYSFK